MDFHHGDRVSRVESSNRKKSEQTRMQRGEVVKLAISPTYSHAACVKTRGTYVLLKNRSRADSRRSLTSLRSLGGILRSRSAPPTPRDAPKQLPGSESEGATPSGGATPTPAVVGSKSLDGGTGPEGTYPAITATPPEEVQQQPSHGIQLPQIV